MNKSKIPSHWTIKSVGDVIISAKNGGTPKRSNSEYWGGEIGWLSSGEVTGKEIYEAEESITQVALEKTSAKLFPENSVLVAMYGDGKTKGQSAVLKKEMSGNQAICCLEPDPEVIRSEYLSYYFKHIKPELVSKARGAGQDNLNQKLILENDVPVPPISKQDSIVSRINEQFAEADSISKTISSLDSKINELEDSMSSFLLTGREELASGDLSGVPTEAELPNEWKLEKLSQICSVNSINHNLERDFPDEEFKYVSISDIENSTGEIKNHKLITGSNSPSRAKREMREGDTIVSTVRPYLRGFAQVPSQYDGEICSTGFAVLTPSDLVNKDYLFYAVRSPLFVDQLKKEQRGAAYPAVGIKDVKNSVITLPPVKKQEEIVDRISNVQNFLQASRNSISNTQVLLKQYRASILDTAFHSDPYNPSNRESDRSHQNKITESGQTSIPQFDS